MSGFVYFIQRGDDGPIKIGHSVNPEGRMNQLQLASAEKLNLLGTINGSRGLERKTHARFSHLKIRGEWYQHDESLIKFSKRNMPGAPMKTYIVNASVTISIFTEVEAATEEDAVEKASELGMPSFCHGCSRLREEEWSVSELDGEACDIAAEEKP